MKTKNSQSGFIALMATIIISLILLVMAAEEGMSGFHARFNILGTEAKEQATALAEGCADQALAALVTDPAYFGNSTTTNSIGTCHVFPIDTSIHGLVTIKTQAEVRGSYANLEISMNTGDIHLGSIPLASAKGTVVVIAHVVNDGSGTKTASNFTMSMTATNPSKASFSGSESGVAITVDPGSYTAGGTALAGYAKSVSTNCTGTVAAGELKFCTVVFDDITTTLAVVANVVNNNGGTKLPADVPLFIDGAPVTLGTRNTVLPGSHTVSSSAMSGYATSTWGYQCGSTGTINVALGENKTCIINYDDLPPPTPSCADTVMVLDRTGSMSSTDRTNEGIAAKSLVDLYSSVLPPTPLPQMGVGSMGGLDGSGASVPTTGWLSTAYNTLKNTITTMMNTTSSVGSDLSAGITAASNELNGIRHIAGKQKVIVLVSDGDPNQPTGTANYDTGFKSSAGSVQNAAGDSWNTPAGAYASGGLDANSTASSGSRERYYTFGFGGGAGLPTGSAVAGIETVIDAWATAPTVNAPANTATLLPAGQGHYTAWTNGESAIDEPDPVSCSSSDSIIESTANDRESVIIDLSTVPNGATLTGVDIISYDRGDSASGGTYKTFALLNSADTSAVSSLTATGSSGGCNSPKTQTINVTAVKSATTTLEIGVTKVGGSGNANNAVRVGALRAVVYYTVPTAGAVACQLGVDLSWNGGSNWSNEKTKTLTGTEAAYILGSSSDDWSSSHTWQPTDFSDTNFRARVHAIDPGGACDNSAIDHLDWLQLKIYYTQASDPVQAALNAADAAKLSGTDIFTIHFGSDPAGYPGKELLANLATGITPVAGHQNGSLSDGTGGGGTDTGLISPTAQSADTGGTGNGFELNPANAFTDGGSYASNINGAGDRHRYSGYNISIPPGATINGIVVRPDWWLDSTSGTNSVDIELSWDGGATWTAKKNNANETTNDTNNKLVPTATNDMWGHTWVANDFLPANFRVRITSNSTVASRDFFLDWIPVRVYYTVANTENSDGDNFFVAPSSVDMQGIFNFIGNQVCPAAGGAGTPPAPTTATIFVLTSVINNNSGASTASDFPVSVSAVNPSPAAFTGSASGVAVTVGPGNYNSTEGAVNGYAEIPGASCSSLNFDGTQNPITAGETRVCVFTNDDIPPPPPPPNFNVTTGSWTEVPTATSP